jgi:hypothetical protein
MDMKKTLFALFSFAAIAIAVGPVRGQGGWRQWDVFMLDGTSVYASPLQLRADGRLTRSMDPKEEGILLSNIDYIAIRADWLPPAPTGKFKQDLVVMMDGKRSLGKVTFTTLKFSEGTIVQNGKEMTLEKVAYIKFAHSPAKTKKRGKS